MNKHTALEAAFENHPEHAELIKSIMDAVGEQLFGFGRK